ncbi:MAG: substrate-binding domain-containing protein [Candidatus Promineifilaceae bacterium]
MKKNLFLILITLLITSFVLVACGGTAEAPVVEEPAEAEVPAEEAEAPAEEPAAEEPTEEVAEEPAEEASTEGMKIAFFVSDLSNVFHQAQVAEATAYAKEKYGAEVFAFDGQSDAAVMTQNIDQVAAQGMDAATMQIWDPEAAKPGVLDALDQGIIMTSFFSPLADTGIPVARSDEPGISFEMGAEAARQWKEAHPDVPITFVQLGWPDHTEVVSGRGEPFKEGILSVDPEAVDLGVMDAKADADTAKQIMLDLVTQHPEINIIYSQASNLTVGTMAGLIEAGRGTMDNGVPTTEIVASVDFDEVEYNEMYDPNSSLKLSMGLPPKETARGRIDLIMDIASGKTAQVSDPAEEFFYKAFNINYWDWPQAEAAAWLNDQFGTNIEVAAEAEEPAEEAADVGEGMKIAFFVSDLSNVFHQAQVAEATAYAKEKYGAEVFAFDGQSDAAVMTQNIDQVAAQGMDAATMQIWDPEAAKPGVLDALDQGIIMTSFFSPLADTGIPVARSDEPGISFEMGAEAARQWKEAHPDVPITFVQLGWPDHTEVVSGRGEPFKEGILSVDPEAVDLGVMDAKADADTAKQIMLDLVTQHPEINIIYSQASNLTVGTMAGLIEAGRGTMDNGVPTTEIVASVDFDEVEYNEMYDPNSSLKLSMGLPPKETARGRIDLIMDIASGKTAQISDPAEEFFYEAFNINYWDWPQEKAAAWLNDQFGTNIE